VRLPELCPAPSGAQEDISRHDGSVINPGEQSQEDRSYYQDLLVQKLVQKYNY